MYIETKAEALIASDIANQYFGEGAYEQDDFEKQYVENVLNREFKTRLRIECAREIAAIICARRTAVYNRRTRRVRTAADKRVRTEREMVNLLVKTATRLGVPEDHARKYAIAYLLDGSSPTGAARVMASDYELQYPGKIEWRNYYY